MVFKLSDGRELNRKQLRGDVFKSRAGIITKKRCAECGIFKDIREYPTHGDSLYCDCDECRRPKWSKIKYGDARRAHGFNGKEKLVDRATSVGGVKHLVCNLCKRNLPIIEFTRGARCSSCKKTYAKWYFYKKRAERLFGEKSEQYKEIESTGCMGDFSSIASKYGFLNIKRIYERIPESHPMRMRPSMARIDTNNLE